jgi:hypothetical protein
MDSSQQFYLLISNSDTEAVISTLKTSSYRYKKKMLESSAENWVSINHILQDSSLAAVIVKLTGSTYRRITQDDYREIANHMLESLSKTKHVIYVHESLMNPAYVAEVRAGAVTLRRTPGPQAKHFLDQGRVYVDDDEVAWLVAHTYRSFEPPSAEAMAYVNGLFQRYSLNVIPYRTNAELSVMASSFVKENDSSLLFRIYVPANKIWARETEKLLSLFTEWLSRVKGHKVRRGGYTTAKGQVHEFYSDDHTYANLDSELREFSDFLDACVGDQVSAEKLLESLLADTDIRSTVDRYSKEGRRLRLDIRQDYESRALSIRHRLEAELSDLNLSRDDIGAFVSQVMPLARGIIPVGLTSISAAPAMQVTVNYNQQTIDTVYGVAGQVLNGTNNLSSVAEEVLALIREVNPVEAEKLVSDVYEAEDDGAPSEARLTAKQRVKSFLFTAGGAIGIGLAQKYAEGLLGLG